MANAVVRDHVVWLKHIHDDAVLSRHLGALTAGAVVALKVDGVAGKWVKMDNGKDGRPTPGLRPLGAVKDYWNALFNEKRGELVTIELAGGDDAGPATPHTTPSPRAGLAEEAVEFRNRLERADPIMRKAAIAALLDTGRQTFVPQDGFRFNRDEIHDRDGDRRG